MELKKILAFARKDFLVQTSYRIGFIMQFVSILFSVATYFFLSRLFEGAVNPMLSPYGGDYFGFVLIGVAFTHYLQVGLNRFSIVIRKAQVTGTLEAVLSTPTSLSTYLAGSSVWAYFFTTVRVAFYLALGAILFGLDLGAADFASALAVLALTILCFSGIGMLAAAFIVLFKQGDPTAWVFTALSSLLGGMLYPVEVLPAWLQKVSALIPLTYSLRAMRLAVLQGHGLRQLAGDVTALALFTVILLPLGATAFKLAVDKAKRDGSLSKY